VSFDSRHQGPVASRDIRGIVRFAFHERGARLCGPS
jgi:hypothetical protein